MRKSRTHEIENITQAMKNKKLWMGRLLSPSQTAEAVKDRTIEPKIDGWFLCTSVHPSMYAVCMTEPMHFSLVPLASNILIIVQQCRGWQNRMILPLIGETVTAFLQSFKTDGTLQLSLANGDSDDALITTITPYGDETLRMLQTDNNQSEAGIDALSRFLPSLASMLLELTSFKNLSNSDELREVCVSCVLSDELQDRLMQNNIQDIFQLLSQDTTLH